MSPAETVFFAALAKVDPVERAAFLNEACGADADLLRRVERLLAAHPQVGSFLQDDAAALPAPPIGEGAGLRNGATVEQPTVSERAGTVIGPYKLLQQIGEGGMGTVFMAEQAQPIQRKVALKIIKPGMDTRQVIARFEAERQALAMMDHVNIARVLDAGTTEAGRPYFVMELVHGMPITRYCDDNHLTPRQRLELFVPVCHAIQHAHQKGIIHRDVKPSNVLVTLYDGKPVPKVIDFGVAKATEQRLTERTLFTQYGTLVGTLEYMSPEQAEMSALGVDTRSDIFSLGVLLYELLTGNTPLIHKRVREAAYGEVLRLIKEEEPPRPSTRLSDSGEALASISAQRHMEPAKLSRLMRGELDWIAMKCLEKDRNRRYETANGLAHDIERYLHDVPVQACPPSVGYRLRKFVRRNRHAVAAATIVVTALLSGVGVSIWQAARATLAERDAVAGWADAERERNVATEARKKADGDRLRAEQAEGEAKREGAVARAVSEFLQQDLLGQADVGNQPSPSDGLAQRNPDVTVRELLDRAGRKIGGKFAGQPLTEAAVRATIGAVYSGLGRYPEANAHLERAVDLFVAKLGADHPDTLESKHRLASLHYLQGQYAKADALFSAVVRGRTAKLGADHPSTLNSKNSLANVYEAQGQYAKVEPLYLVILQTSMAKNGAEHPDTVRGKHNLACLYQDLGRYAEAEPLELQALRGYTDLVGSDNPATLVSKEGLASLYTDMGRYAKAEALFLQVVEVSAKKNGADHPDTLYCMHDLATLYYAQGQYAKAEPLLLKVLNARVVKLGADHSDTLSTRNALGDLYRAQHQYAKAEPLLLEVLKARATKLGADHPQTLASKSSLAQLYQSQHQYAKAEPLAVEVLQARTSTLGADHPHTLASKSSLAQLYQEEGRYAKAEPLALEALNGRMAKLGADHPHTIATLEQLVRLYDGWKKKDKADEWRKKLEKAKSASKPPTRP